MAKFNLDNFPQPKMGWSNGQKFALIAVTIGLAVLVWHLITMANEKRKQTQAKMAESEAMLKIAEQEKATKEKVTAALGGQALTDAINQITAVAVKEEQKKQNTEGSSETHEGPTPS
jgi:hypothetical protein